MENEPDHETWKDKYNKKIKPIILITKLTGNNSLEELLEKIINNQKTEQKLTVLSTEIKDFFNIITIGSMNKELSQLFDWIINSSAKNKLMHFVEVLDDFPKFFKVRYKDDIKTLCNGYNVHKINVWSNEIRNIIYIAFKQFTIDIEFYYTYFDISIVKEGTKHNTPIIDVKKNTTKWPFSDKIIDNGITKRYRTKRENAFNKDNLLKMVSNILDAFELNKTNL